jgi:hypothetical protein
MIGKENVMTKKQFGIVVALFSIMLVLALVGGTWKSVLAEGTQNLTGLGIPVTGCAAGLPDMQSCTGPYVENLGGVCVPLGIQETVNAVDDKNVPGKGQITPITSVLKVTVPLNGVDSTDYIFGEAVIVYFTNQDAIQKYMADPTKYTIMWYDPAAEKWVAVETMLLDGKLVDKNIHAGLYIVAEVNQ